MRLPAARDVGPQMHALSVQGGEHPFNELTSARVRDSDTAGTFRLSVLLKMVNPRKASCFYRGLASGASHSGGHHLSHHGLLLAGHLCPGHRPAPRQGLNGTLGLWVSTARLRRFPKRSTGILAGVSWVKRDKQVMSLSWNRCNSYKRTLSRRMSKGPPALKWKSRRPTTHHGRSFFDFSLQ